MQSSLETYFLINFAIDTALIAIVSRANECMNLRRILICGFLAASYAVLIVSVSAKLNHPAVQILLLCILAIILCGECDIHKSCLIAFQLLGSAMMLGGIGSLFSPQDRIPWVLLGTGMIFLSIFLSKRNRRLTTWDVTVLLSLGGRFTRFQALIDTGNRLHEPISGLPVLIAESALLQNLLPDQNSVSLPLRRVSFGVLGSAGTLRCFHPDTVLICRGDQLVRAPDVWVAIYPGKIPGASRALAPPSFAIIPGRS